jgi:hypothetical protein
MESRSNSDTSYYSFGSVLRTQYPVFSPDWLIFLLLSQLTRYLFFQDLCWSGVINTWPIMLISKRIKIKATTKDYSPSMFNPFGYGNVGSVINKCWYPSLAVIFNFIWSKKNRQIFYPDMITDIMYILNQQYRNERCSKILSLGRVFIVTQNSWQVAM